VIFDHPYNADSVAPAIVLARPSSNSQHIQFGAPFSRHDRAVPRGLAYHRLMVRIGAIVLQVSDTDRAGAFWSQALGYQRGANQDFLLPSEGGLPRLHLDETDRTHLDLWAANEDEQLAEVERLETLGATRVEWNYPQTRTS